MPDDSAPRTKYFRPASVERDDVAVEGGDDVERQAHAARARDRARSGRRPRSSASCRRSASRMRTGNSNLRSAHVAPGSSTDMQRWRRPSRRSASSFMKRAKRVDDEAAVEGASPCRPPSRRDARRPTISSDRRRASVDELRGRALAADRRRSSAAPWRRRARISSGRTGSASGRSKPRSSRRPCHVATERELGLRPPPSAVLIVVDQRRRPRRPTCRGPAPDRSRTGW